MKNKFLLVLILFASNLKLTIEHSPDSNTLTMTPKIYSNLFVRRREEHKLFVKHLLNGNYEKSYRMLELAFEKIIEIITESNKTLSSHHYKPQQGFPQNQTMQDSVSLILENSCLAGEIILNLPEISYRILKKYSNWVEIFKLAIDFVLEFQTEIVDDKTVKMLSLFKQKIREDYNNPYYKNAQVIEKQPRKAKKKHIRKGPQLVGRNEL